MRKLGARSVPVVSRGDKFTFAQNIKHVIAFLDLKEDGGPKLSPAQLVERMNVILGAAQRFIRQMPDDKLETLLPNRPRTYRVLGHHLFRLTEHFVECARDGAAIAYDGLVAPPPEDMRTSAAIAEYGANVVGQVNAWWAQEKDKTGKRPVQTYYGQQELHELMERTTWHSGQHVRQWMMMLEMAGIKPDQPLSDADFAGLPMPQKVWDE